MTPTNLEKLRAGIGPAFTPDGLGLMPDIVAAESLMRQAADEIEELRRENARLQEVNRRLLDNEPISLINLLADKPAPGEY